MSRHSASYARTKREQLTLIQNHATSVNGRLIRWPHDLCYGHSGSPYKRDDSGMTKRRCLACWAWFSASGPDVTVCPACRASDGRRPPTKAVW
jgi:hypothetical protein